MSEKALKKKLKAQQEKIDELHKKISDNLLDNAGKTLEKEEDKNSDGFFSFFKGREEVSAVVPEKIQLYKNDVYSITMRIVYSHFKKISIKILHT